MEEIIVENLINLSQLEQYSEKDVVYLLVESFKLLEQHNKLSEFNVIRFYRNWSCHAKLSADAMKIFKEVYGVLIESEKKDTFPTPQEINHIIESKFELYSFHNLKREIELFSKTFLREFKINFINLERPLQKIIISTPLVVTRDNKKNGEEIFRLEVREQGGSNATPPFDDLTFYIVYMIGGIEISIVGGSRQKFLSFT